MTTYKVYSKKDQGSYKKGDFMYNMTEAQYNEKYFGCEYNQVSKDMYNSIYITKNGERKTDNRPAPMFNVNGLI